MTPEFECRNCGVCCSQIPLIVAGDIHVIIKHVGCDPEDFIEFYEPDDFDEGTAPDDQWLEMDGGRRMIGMKRRNETCVFRRDGRCSIYVHRPLMCALHPYCPRDETEEEPEFNLHCHHGCKGITKGPLSPEAFKDLQKSHDVFSRREWDFDDIVKRWNRKGRKNRSEEAFLKFIGVKVRERESATR